MSCSSVSRLRAAAGAAAYFRCGFLIIDARAKGAACVEQSETRRGVIVQSCSMCSHHFSILFFVQPEFFILSLDKIQKSQVDHTMFFLLFTIQYYSRRQSERITVLTHLQLRAGAASGTLVLLRGCWFAAATKQSISSATVSCACASGLALGASRCWHPAAPPQRAAG